MPTSARRPGDRGERRLPGGRAPDDVDGARIARKVWAAIEPIHAVTYFAPACRAGLDELGLKGFFMGYFAARSAPLGQVHPSVVLATFYGFAPGLVHRALPDAWSYTTPAACLEARATSAAVALRQVHPTIEADAPRLLQLLAPVARAAVTAGRPLAAANQTLPLHDDPVAALWQAATTLREHRGDGHVAALVAYDIGPVESHVLAAAAGTFAGQLVTAVRGWSDDEWAAAVDAMARRGLVEHGDDPYHPRLTPDGESLRLTIEDATDEAAAQPYLNGLTEAGLGLVSTLAPRVAKPVIESGLLPEDPLRRPPA